MKLVFVDRFGANAIWSVITPISEALLERGHKVTWFRLNNSGRRDSCIPPDGVQVVDVAVPFWGGGWKTAVHFLWFYFCFNKWIKEWQPDIVHTNFAIPGIIARKIAKKQGCKVVSTQHELFGSMNRLFQWGTKVTEHYADVVTYVSKTVAASFHRDAYLIDVGGAGNVLNSTEKCKPCHTVIYNSVNFGEISEVTSQVSWRDPNKVVCVGRMVPEKGQKDLVRAFAQAVLDRPGLELHLYGSGPEENILKRLCQELGIVERVTFHGWVTKHEVLKAMAGAALVVQPSDGSQEGFGLSLVEAMACGCKVVASDIPVFREVVGEADQSVYFCRPGNARALRDMLLLGLKESEPIAFENMKKLTEKYSSSYLDYFAIYQQLVE